MVLEVQTNLFLNIGIVILAATFVGYITRALKQPLIPAYILTGLLIGPWGLKLITEGSIIGSLAEMGIAFLLFIVGLEIDLSKLKEVGLIGIFGGLIQVITVYFASYWVALRLGFGSLEAFYIGLILTFSSTMIVVKLLSDKNEINTLHGRVILAILIMQDIAVIFALSLLETINNLELNVIWVSLFKGIVLLIATLILARYILPFIFKFGAKSQELLFLSSLAVVFFFAGLANYLGFSIAVGAFLAGLSLATLPYNIYIVGKVMPLRDFFATLFFVSLGMELKMGGFNGLIKPLIIFTLIVILLKPVVLFLLCILFGYKRRTGLLTGLSLAQISEFSLILVAMGLHLGHISSNIFSIAVLLAIISIVLTSYFVKYDEKIYNKLAKPLEFFERFSLLKSKEIEHFPHHAGKEVVIFGAHRMGGIFIRAFRKLRDSFVVVDFDPLIIKNLIEKRIPCIYGDMGSEEVLKRLSIHSAKLVISTVPNEQDNEFLIQYIKKYNPKVMVIVTSFHGSGALKMYELGADYVIVPHLLSGEMVAKFLKELMEERKDIDELRVRHIRRLREMGY